MSCYFERTLICGSQFSCLNIRKKCCCSQGYNIILRYAIRNRTDTYVSEVEIKDIK